ncbi:unnamed protein product [Vicia faba]|uniref:Uncharacterized protein n=1 Tax=Vicia faba TaxID=3906 RepID=A0AAV1BBZ6_VICFA|nr:unnamed protein product [Vicia faba]
MTIVVISLLDNTYTNLIQEIFSCKDIQTWILVSRLSFEKEPIVVLLSVYSVSPVPDIRTFLQKDAQTEGSYSASVSEKRWKIDVHLKELLRNLEDSWLGSWRCLL